MLAGNAIRSKGRFALIALCLAVTYVLGLAHLKAHPIVLEEWDSVKHLAASPGGPTNSIAETIQSTIVQTRQDHSPGYFILLNVWSRLAGRDLFSLRLLSVFTSMLALACTYRLALLTSGVETARDAVLFASFVAFVTYYSHTVRMYALLALLSVVVAWCYWRVNSRAGQVPRRYWLGFIAAASATLWVHYAGTILLASLGVYHLFFVGKSRRWFQICLAALVAALSFLPWLPVLIQGVGGRDVPRGDALSASEATLAIASVYTNGVPILVLVAGIAAAARYRRLSRSQRYIVILAAVLPLLMLLGNEFAPLIIARRFRYTIILAMPWICALAIALNQLPRWRLLRIPALIVWVVAFAAYTGSDQLLLYTNWLTLELHKSPPYQDMLYQPNVDTEMGDYIVSFHPDKDVLGSTVAYYGNHPDRWSGLIHISMNNDGEPQVQSSNSSYMSIESMALWRFRAWLVYNPQQTDLKSISAFTDSFLRYYRPCGRFVDKPESVIELFGPKAVPCAAFDGTASSPMHIQYDNGAVLRNITVELDSERLSAYLWWPQALYAEYAYSLQVFDLDGTKAEPQVDTILTDVGLYVEHIDISSLPAGDYVLKLVVYGRETLDSQPGAVVDPEQRFARDVEVGSFTIAD